MKNNFQTFLAFFLLLGFPAVVLASPRIISLKDGSQLKGEIVSAANGVYTVKTQNLGKIELQEGEIISISSDSMTPPPAPTVAGTGNLQEKAAGLQNQILSDPKLLTDLQNLTQDD